MRLLLVISHLIDKQKIRMLPNHFPLFPSLTPQMYQNSHFPFSFYQFPFQYYLPLPLERDIDTYHLFQPKIQRSTKQYQSKVLEKGQLGIVVPQKSSVKKKYTKLQRGFEQIQTANKNQLKRNTGISEQKEGRNANSNLLRMFFRRLEFTLQNNPERMQKIWKKFNFNITIEDFTHWITEAYIDYRNYIRVPGVKKLLKTGSKIRQHSKILRILFKMFIDEESVCCYLTSKKIKRDDMPFNLRSIRTMYKELFDAHQ